MLYKLIILYTIVLIAEQVDSMDVDSSTDGMSSYAYNFSLLAATLYIVQFDLLRIVMSYHLPTEFFCLYKTCDVKL